MTTVIDESFSRCSVSGKDSTSGSGEYVLDPAPAGKYEDDAAKYGYGDATAADAAMYGYGDDHGTAEADPYGYGDAAPDPVASDPYGYGDAAPDPVASDPYGYGDAAPDPVASDPYGYGDAAPDDAHIAHHRTQSSMSAESTDSNGNWDDGSGEARRRRERPRRRGSVTKYSLEETHETQKNHQDSMQPGDAPPSQTTCTDGAAFEVPINDGDANGAPLRRERKSSTEISDDGATGDVNVDDMSSDELETTSGHEKKKKKKRFGRFRIRRNRSGMSTGSNHSASSCGSKD